MSPWSSSTRQVGGGEASPTEVDAYAQRLFQQQSATASSFTEPDSSLGPYVTSVLRATDPQTPLVQLAEYDNLIELIQEHCWVDSVKAMALLEKITTAVRTRQIPFLVDEEANSIGQPTSSQQAGAAGENVISPRAAEMISGDLWGAIDDGSSSPTKPSTKATFAAAPYGHRQPLHSEADFPPLGATSTPPPAGQQHQTTSAHYDAYQLEQAFESSVDILLSMNPDISEDAARQALQLVQGDVNWGQYLVDLALTAPPVCRHLLNDGCYRRDCQFSHDTDGHTCVFWLRGRCGKGSACPFRHGFNEKALGAVLPRADAHYDEQLQEQHTSPVTTEDPPLPSAGSTTGSTGATGTIWGRTSSTSFAQVASQGGPPTSEFPELANGKKPSSKTARKVDIPQDLWHAHENRDSAAFYITDPLERYEAVAATVRRKDVIDLHFQSTKTFATVLRHILPQKLVHSDVWIVTGTGHHVGTRTHQKGGGALESVVSEWLAENGYNFARGRDKNGLGGALLVER